MKKIPFPPPISVEEIVKIQLTNGIECINQTMNAFMIYRKVFNRLHKNSNLSWEATSKLASISWKGEPKHVKAHYNDMSKRVKESFKEKFPSLRFIDSNPLNANKNHISSKINHIPEKICASQQQMKIGQSSQNSAYSNFPPHQISTCSNFQPQPVNTIQGPTYNIIHSDPHNLLNMYQNTSYSIIYGFPFTILDQNAHLHLDINQTPLLLVHSFYIDQDNQ